MGRYFVLRLASAPRDVSSLICVCASWVRRLSQHDVLVSLPPPEVTSSGGLHELARSEETPYETWPRFTAFVEAETDSHAEGVLIVTALTQSNTSATNEDQEVVTSTPNTGAIRKTKRKSNIADPTPSTSGIVKHDQIGNEENNEHLISSSTNYQTCSKKDNSTATTDVKNEFDSDINKLEAELNKLRLDYIHQLKLVAEHNDKVKEELNNSERFLSNSNAELSAVYLEPEQNIENSVASDIDEICEENDNDDNASVSTLNETATEWTLLHPEATDEVIELIPGSRVYVNELHLNDTLLRYRDTTSLARHLMTLVFTDRALKICNLKRRGPEKRKVLDAHARQTLITYVLQKQVAYGWRILIAKEIEKSLGNFLIEYRKS